ncbi:uncharacterized protein LOC108915929 [Anoplophora glabripennis]|uniref:uncharacterized protein LOC108915929 n=1 Tax=Anoplophora glabripennis TaxID=217634 RepID=UPI000875A5BD|nr:uncharacterized protein LOC108915929 [Anoplophora glabripennis]
MTGVREPYCRLCLKIIADKSFEVINNVIRDILDVLLLKLKLDDVTKEVICSVCKSKLYAALDFKSACLNTDNIIIPYVDSEKMLQLDLREVYRKEKKDESISENQKICRLCMQLVKSDFRCIREEELETIQKLTPEMNINIIIDPVVCKVCLDSLCTHNSFCRECLEVEENFKGSSDCQATESLVGTSPSNLFVKTENLDREFDIKEMEMSIKAEIVDIKSENEERSDEPLESPDNKPFEKSDRKVAKDDGCKCENRSTSKYNKKKKQERNELYRCDKCSYKTGSKIRFAAHCARCGKDSEVYNCKTCVYTTEHEKLFQRHQLRHKCPSQVQMYRCNDCDYETKNKSSITRHQLTHKDPSQVQLYKCNDCDYKSKYRYCIKQHQLMHKDPSQVQMYRCNDCDFETKYRNHIRRHQLKLCLKIIADKSFEVINNVIRDILDVLLLKLKLDDVSKDKVICSVCKRKLYAALDFKSACLNTDNIIIPYVDCEKMLQLDLREVYRKEKRDESISENQKICRLCMQLVKSEFRCIREEELETIQKLTPEMNINIIIDPVVCMECLDSLCTHNSFSRECLEVEENFKGSSDCQATESQVGTSPSNLFVKTENLDREFDINEMEMSIKADIVDIKSEDEERSDTPLESSDNEPFEESVCKDEEADGCKHEDRSRNKYNMKKKQKHSELYRCEKCCYETGNLELPSTSFDINKTSYDFQKREDNPATNSVTIKTKSGGKSKPPDKLNL